MEDTKDSRPDTETEEIAEGDHDVLEQLQQLGMPLEYDWTQISHYVSCTSSVLDELIANPVLEEVLPHTPHPATLQLLAARLQLLATGASQAHSFVHGLLAYGNKVREAEEAAGRKEAAEVAGAKRKRSR